MQSVSPTPTSPRSLRNDFSKCTRVPVTPQLLHPLWLPVFFRVKCYSWRCPRSHPAASQGCLWAPEPGLLGWHWRWAPALYWLAPEDVLSGCPPPLHAVGALGAGLLNGRKCQSRMLCISLGREKPEPQRGWWVFSLPVGLGLKCLPKGARDEACLLGAAASGWSCGQLPNSRACSWQWAQLGTPATSRAFHPAPINARR